MRMKVANVDGLVTLFYDGSRELFDYELEQEWWHQLYVGYKKDDEWMGIMGSDECKQYWRERLSWQQIIVVEGVTEIPESTFQYCFNIKKVIFANTVVRIEDCAFFDCEGLDYIKLPINLEYIGEPSFQQCNLSSVFLPPRCRQVRDYAFADNTNLKIVNVPQDVDIFYETKLLAASPLGDEEGRYNCSHEEAVHNWMKNINNDDKYALHRACCSFQPLKEVIFTILEEKGIKAFKVKNGAGITPSQYLKENPYADINEMDVIRDYTLKMMGEI